MGACLDKPALTIGIKTVKQSRLKTIKTYQDALKAAGRECHPSASIMVVKDDIVSFVTASARFQIVDEMVFKGSHIPIRRLYGRRS
jgi:hypothetical protein